MARRRPATLRAARLLVLALLAVAAAAAPLADAPSEDEAAALLSAEDLAAIAAEKAAVAAAAADPAAAADAYFARLAAANAAPHAAAAAGLQPSAHALLWRAGAAEMARYRSNYLATLARVDALNRRSGRGLAYGINDMAHLSDAEWRSAYATGRKKRKRGQLKEGGDFCGGLSMWADSPLAAEEPVASVDWRERGRVTAVKDQGSCGGCVAFANIAVLEAAYIGSRPGLDPATAALSEQDAMNCLQGNQCDGAWGYEFIDRAVCNGVAFASDSPYRAVDNDACNTLLPRVSPNITGYAFVPPNPTDLRRALARGVVSVGVNADGASFRNYKRGVLGCGSGGRALNHEVAVVGYTPQVSGKKANGAFIIKNSWGASWGEGGFFRVQAECKPRSRGPRALYLDDVMAAAWSGR
ncbi:MAG: hypothetical protein J3K34DRAFT_527155 [Monoraphidium minutum]|nr:MAG: hypothetical protein J3K34DRAFT_527155 [Monoraphidium minutum]